MVKEVKLPVYNLTIKSIANIRTVLNELLQTNLKSLLIEGVIKGGGGTGGRGWGPSPVGMMLLIHAMS